MPFDFQDRLGNDCFQLNGHTPLAGQGQDFSRVRIFTRHQRAQRLDCVSAQLAMRIQGMAQEGIADLRKRGVATKEELCVAGKMRECLNRRACLFYRIRVAELARLAEISQEIQFGGECHGRATSAALGYRKQKSSAIRSRLRAAHRVQDKSLNRGERAAAQTSKILQASRIRRANELV